MQKTDALEDMKIDCVDCSRLFVFTAGEQEWFASRGFYLPKRCPLCRRKKKARRKEEENNQDQQSEREIIPPNEGGDKISTEKLIGGSDENI